MEKYRAILKHQAKKAAPALLQEYQLECRQIEFGDDPVLYIAKPNWTNRFDQNRKSTIGIFFSIWVSRKLIERQQFAYNIHSKQLHKLPGYQLESRPFAESFRSAVKPFVGDWPGIRMDYGPGTLLQGHDQCNPEDFSEKIARRVADFVSIHGEIDQLLDAAQK